MKILLSLLMAVMFLAGNAVAEEDEICDGHNGAAYGLCKAYCEAMQCGEPDQQASEVACSRVSSLFETLTGTLPPCAPPPPLSVPHGLKTNWTLHTTYALSPLSLTTKSNTTHSPDVLIL